MTVEPAKRRRNKPIDITITSTDNNLDTQGLQKQKQQQLIWFHDFFLVTKTNEQQTCPFCVAMSVEDFDILS